MCCSCGHCLQRCVYVSWLNTGSCLHPFNNGVAYGTSKNKCRSRLSILDRTAGNRRSACRHLMHGAGNVNISGADHCVCSPSACAVLQKFGKSAPSSGHKFSTEWNWQGSRNIKWNLQEISCFVCEPVDWKGGLFRGWSAQS